MSPKTNEFTLSLGRQWGAGYWKAMYTWRNPSDMIDDYINDPTAAGKGTVVRDGVNYGTFDKVLYKNTPLPTRDYQAFQFEARATIMKLPVQGYYTIQRKNPRELRGRGRQPAGQCVDLARLPGDVHGEPLLSGRAAG